MKKSILLTSAMLVTGVLFAAEPEAGLSFKVRTQYGFEVVDGVRNGLGAGFGYGFKVGPGILNAEVGYQYFSGKQYRQPVPANSLGYITDDPDPSKINSVDSRKNSLEGFSIRGSYNMKLTGSMSWQVGAALGALKSHHESMAEYTNSPTGTADGFWQLSLEKTKWGISPYAGVRWDFDEIGAIEVNLILASYKQVTVEPVLTQTTATYAIGDKTVTRPKLEFGYVFKF